MPSGFEKIRFNIADKKDDDLRSVGTRGLATRGIGILRREENDKPTFNSDEAAARFYLGRVLGVDERPLVRGLTSPDRAEVVPDLRFRGTQLVPSTTHTLVMFEQTKAAIPIFGSRVVVQLDAHRELINIGGDVADISKVPPVAALSPAEALKRVAQFAAVAIEKLKDVQPPELNFFHDKEKDNWHLAYLCKKVPAAPTGFLKSVADRKSQGHGRGASPRQHNPILNYLVDAHDGAIIFYYSAAPMIDIPSECFGEGELEPKNAFWGRQVGIEFEMVDPRRSIKTFDLAGSDIDTSPIPGNAVRNAMNDWKAKNKAAVSAHVNATKVYNFYKSVLLRDGIDDKGMDLVSIVNCTYPREEHPPEWHNAVWYDNKMWYGQDRDPGGPLMSYSRFLDVIAHELTHGVTEHTSNLVYQGQSGALNESFSDIFGIAIANWDPANPDRDVSAWEWQLGRGLGGGGKPLRDLSNPKVTGDPDHMNGYLHTKQDNGGVHTNSNIHNKAAYNVLTATDAAGKRVFRPMEVMELYYLCLTRLSSLATFSDALQALLEVASVYYAGDPAKRQERSQHITDAYKNVGIL